MLGGAQYGVLAGSLRTPRIRYGAAVRRRRLGTGYVVLPAAKLYQPIWEYDRMTLAKDLSAHLVYGLTHGGRVPAPVSSSKAATS